MEIYPPAAMGSRPFRWTGTCSIGLTARRHVMRFTTVSFVNGRNASVAAMMKTKTMNTTQ